MDRIRRGFFSCNVTAALVIAILSVVCLAFGRWILFAFCPDEDVVANGLQIIRVTFPLYFLYSLFEVTGGIVRGLGRSLQSMAIVIVNLCVIRVICLEITDRYLHTIKAVASIYPFTWFLAVVSFVGYTMYLSRRVEKECQLC